MTQLYIKGRMTAGTLRTAAVLMTAAFILGTAANAARSDRSRNKRASEPPPEEEEAREQVHAERKNAKTPKRRRGRDVAAQFYDAAMTAYRLGDFAAAEQSLSEALDSDDGFMPAWALRAQVRGAAGDMDGMRHDLVRPLKNTNSDREFRRARADAKTLAGRPAEALKDYDAILDKEPSNSEAYLGRGRARRALGDLDGAIEDFSQAVKERPDHHTARVHLARAYADADKAPQAVRELTRVLNGSRDFAMAYEVLAAIMAGQGDERAFAAWSRAIQLSPENPRVRIGRALMYLKKGNKTLAAKDFSEAVRIAPADFSPLYHRGESWFRLGDKEGGLADFTAALKLEVPDPEAAVAMGDRLAENKLEKEAIAMYSKGLSAALSGPRSDAKALASRALRQRAAAYDAAGNGKAALSDLSAAVSAAPEDPEGWMARAALHLKFNDPRRAMADYEKTLALKADNPKALLGHAEILADSGHAEEAQKDLNEAIKADPKLAAAYDRRGRLAVGHGAWDDALKDFMKSVDLQPGDPDFLLDLGIARLNKKEYWKAIAALDRSLQQNGPAAPAKAARAEARAALGMTHQAFQDLDEALKADPQSAELHALLGFVLLKTHQYPEAIRTLDRAVTIDHKDPRAYRLRGLAHAGLGEYSEAGNDLHHAATLAAHPVDELIDLCHAERLRGRFTRAVEACSKALKIDGERGWAYIQRGLAYLASGDASRAARDLDDGIRLDPPRPQIHLARAIAHAALRQYKESDRAYREAMAMDPAAKSADITLGEDPGPAWDFRARIDALHAEIEKDADDPYSYLVAGNALHNAALYDQAILEYTRALESDGRMVAGYLARGSALAAQDSLDAAEQDFRRAVQLAPTDPLTHLNLVTLLTSRRKFADGIKAAIAALKSQADSPHAESFVKAGNLRYFVKELDRAQENYEYAVKFAPGHAAAHNGLGLCHFARKRYEKALESFSRAIVLHPDHDRYYRNRAAAFVNMNQLENAVSDYKMALTVNKDPLMVEEYQRLIEASQARVGASASSK